MSKKGQARNPDTEALLQAHIDRTFPRTPHDFVGKEHLWRIADRHEIRRAVAGKLFMQMCFPVKPAAKYVWWQGGEPVKPSELGLVVSQRDKENLPYPPVSILGTTYGVHEATHREEYRDGLGAVVRIVRADSVAELVTDPARMAQARFTKDPLRLLGYVADELARLSFQLALPIDQPPEQ